MTTPRNRVLEALRHYAVTYQESAHHLARWMDLPTIDGTALGEIIWAEHEGDPLTPTRLSSRVGLTSGATNALINRLEQRGFAVRSRENTDRRIVTLRATERTRERSAAFLDPSARALETVLSDLDDATLETLAELLVRLATVLPTASPASARGSA